ncbi:unnamed protein product [Toxocara canis]|uniref:Serine/threonine-protein phosphatase n=1 Tax=Toxocara canis TaxID=6265 RepID=A0A183UPP3_TOXCA|nr:unnamed protein product [Toxocara canis]
MLHVITGRLTSLEKCIPKCRRGYLTKKQIESYMIAFLQIVRRGDKICEEVDTHSIVEVTYVILHRGAELFWNEPMLIEAPFPEHGLVVVGDLHGYIIDLLVTMLDCGSPAQKHYIFLGDYVDRGSHQIETFLFVLLMKLRWPNHVYMLRGNHETFELNATQHGKALSTFRPNPPRKDSFHSQCKRAFGDENIYHIFGRLFDIMPVAAILGGCGLTTYGLQFHVEIRFSCRLFMPSERYTSYSFNAEGLECVLKALNVKVLLRGHQPFLNGYLENIPQKCYTVHTAPCSRDPFFSGAAFLCSKDGDGYAVVTHTHRVLPDRALVEKSPELPNQKGTSRYINVSAEKKSCDYCAIRIPRVLTTTPHILSHLEIAEWINTYAKQLVLDDDAYKLIANKVGLVAKRYVLFFPVYYDVLYLNGGTFRVAVSEEEKKIITTELSGSSVLAEIDVQAAMSSLAVPNSGPLRQTKNSCAYVTSVRQGELIQ